MGAYSKECIQTFLKNQGQLFDEPVAETPQEAAEFLDEMMAEVVGSAREVFQYLEELGMDVTGLTKKDLGDIAEVFPLSDGRYLIVEG